MNLPSMLRSRFKDVFVKHHRGDAVTDHLLDDLIAAAKEPKRTGSRNGVTWSWFVCNAGAMPAPLTPDDIQIVRSQRWDDDGAVWAMWGSAHRKFEKDRVISGPHRLRSDARASKRDFATKHQLGGSDYLEAMRDAESDAGAGW